MTTEEMIQKLRSHGCGLMNSEVFVIIAKLQAAEELVVAAELTVELCKHYGWPSLAKGLPKPLKAFRAAGKGNE